MNRQKIENKIRPYAYTAALWSTVLVSELKYFFYKISNLFVK